MGKDFYLLDGACEYLGICRRTLHTKLQQGELQGDFYARKWHFSKAQLDAFKKARTRQDTKGIVRKKDKTTHE